MSREPSLRAGLEAGGAPVMWERAVKSLLPGMQELVPRGSRILEIGYGDGLLSCYLHQRLGWQILGLDVSEEAHRTAQGYASRFGLDEGLEFRCISPDEVWSTRGSFDAVFIKTVLYSSPSLDEYGRWLDWVLSVLNPGGIFVNFETGRANFITKIYRRIRGRVYTDLCLYTGKIENLYDARFEILERRYFGGLSQFFAPISTLYYMTSRLEEGLRRRDADNSFIVAMICRRSLKGAASAVESGS